MTDLTSKFRVHKGRRPEDLTAELAERVNNVIHEYDGRMSLAAAIGALEIVKLELFKDHEQR